jgi:tetratricopeptide (TPR) repeat protein
MPSIGQRLGLSRYEAQELYRRALAALLKGDRELDAAIALLNDAISLLPTEAEYWATRGLAYLNKGTDDFAKADFEAALRHNKREMLAHYGLGVIAFRDAEFDAAIAHFTDAYRLAPDRAETFYYLGLTQDRRGEAAQAVEWMTRAHDAFEAAEDKRAADALKLLTQFRKRVK